MLIKKTGFMLAATAMIAAPVAVSAAPARSASIVAAPASQLSLAPSVRANGKSGKSNKVGGAGVLAALLVAGIVAIPVIDAVRDDNSDSN